MTILDSSNLIFAIFGRAADSNTASVLAASNDKTAAINALLSSGASFQSNTELVNAVYTNTMGAELAGSPLVALWTTLLDAGMMDKAQFVSQTMSFLDAFASVPAFADVPFVQTFQARSQVSLSTASNSGVLNSSQLTAILQATTDAATANIAIASANEAKAGAALSADVIKLAQVNIASLASKDASGFAAKLIEQSNAAAAQINAPIIDAANPAAFVAQHGAEVANIAAAAGSTQAAANIAQATNEARAQSGLEPASPTTPATPAAPANPDQGATPATPATAGNAGGAATNAGGYVPSAPATPDAGAAGNAGGNVGGAAAPANPAVVVTPKTAAVTYSTNSDTTKGLITAQLTTANNDNITVNNITGDLNLTGVGTGDNFILKVGAGTKAITLNGGNETVNLSEASGVTTINGFAKASDAIVLGDSLKKDANDKIAITPSAEAQSKPTLANGYVYTSETALAADNVNIAQGQTAYVLVKNSANTDIYKVTNQSGAIAAAKIATVNAITPAELLADMSDVTEQATVAPSTIQATLDQATDALDAVTLATTKVSSDKAKTYNFDEKNAFTITNVSKALTITKAESIQSANDKTVNISLADTAADLNFKVAGLEGATNNLTLNALTTKVTSKELSNISKISLGADTTAFSEVAIEALAATNKGVVLNGKDKKVTIDASKSADGLDISTLLGDGENAPSIEITGLGNKAVTLNKNDKVNEIITVAENGASITGLDDTDVVDLRGATFNNQSDWEVASALPSNGDKLAAKTIYAISGDSNAAFANEEAATNAIKALSAAQASDQNLFLAKVTNNDATDTIIYHTVAGENGALTGVTPTKIVSLLGTADIKSPIYTLKIDGYAVTDAI